MWGLGHTLARWQEDHSPGDMWDPDSPWDTMVAQTLYSMFYSKNLLMKEYSDRKKHTSSCNDLKERERSYRLKVKEQKKIFQVNGNQKREGWQTQTK